MKCKKCAATISEFDISCQSCGALTATTRDDLQKTDPRSSRAISWALIAMGGLGLVFVIANSWTDWYSGLDYVAPTAVLLVGAITLIISARKK
ncbi:hypothetical protein [Candidatus Aquiluna sp. UB-MaderosW2red]|uniref:hypothetical protein n=1 Tax=Candidatus Aquiluna sp. UB-MaderosW2red TaxID=1855377 RepID=UPI000875AF8E|nr:hypothetical protein [Candidatus Aquiluna sp. UB-MaderosW2red]SCX08012.1 hypothetical protein SAMN05216534_0703 [Candidatus Aquiluna sp. UB-MaderosW2red]